MTRRQGSRTAFRRRLRPAVAALWAGALLLHTGCTSLLPVQSTPAPVGQEMGVVINDRGRTLLADRIGPLVERIDGRLVNREGGRLTLRVTRVTDVRGTGSTWTGEQVTIPEEAVLGYRPKVLSKFKTGLFIGAVTTVILATMRLSLDIFGVPTEGPTTGSPQQS